MKRRNYTVGVLTAIALAAGACTKSVHETAPIWKTKPASMKGQGGFCSKEGIQKKGAALTDRGRNLFGLNPEMRYNIGMDLLRNPGGMTPVTYYAGVCYEVVAFVRFLLDDSITSEDLISYRGDEWINRLGLDTARRNEWDGRREFAAGEIIGFYDERWGGFFHAAIATGVGNQIRSVNGWSLGHEWREVVDLRQVLYHTRREGSSSYYYNGTEIRVFIGNPHQPSEPEMGNSIGNGNGTEPTTTPGPDWGVPPVLLPPPIGSPMMQ